MVRDCVLRQLYIRVFNSPFVEQISVSSGPTSRGRRICPSSDLPIVMLLVMSKKGTAIQ